MLFTKNPLYLSRYPTSQYTEMIGQTKEVRLNPRGRNYISAPLKCVFNQTAFDGVEEMVSHSIQHQKRKGHFVPV